MKPDNESRPGLAPKSAVPKRKAPPKKISPKKVPVQPPNGKMPGDTPEERKALVKRLNQILREHGNPAFIDEGDLIDDLPDPQNMDDLIANFDPAESPPEVVTGFLHQGSKGSLTGASKTNKTWSLIDLAVSVASGTPWWGLETTAGKVLFINFEIQDHFFTKRVIAVKQAKGVQQLNGQLEYFGFRGKAEDWPQLVSALKTKLEGAGYSLIIIDPIYKGLGNRDENKAGDIATLLNEIEGLCVKSGAAVVFGHHFAKGSQKFKNVEDRGSGSGVWARDPDSILTITRLEEPDCYVVETVLRNFPQLQPFGLRWQYPLMAADEGINTTKIHEPGKMRSCSKDEVLEALRDNGELTHDEWYTVTCAAIEPRTITMSTFKHRVRELKAMRSVRQVPGNKRTDPWSVP